MQRHRRRQAHAAASAARFTTNPQPISPLPTLPEAAAPAADSSTSLSNGNSTLSPPCFFLPPSNGSSSLSPPFQIEPGFGAAAAAAAALAQAAASGKRRGCIGFQLH